MGENPGYFTQNDWRSEHLSPITWQEMLETGSIISATPLIHILADAKQFLLTTPGPHLFQRQREVPPWFKFWEKLLLSHAMVMEAATAPVGQYGYTPGLKPFEQVGQYVQNLGGKSGSINFGGGEGGRGHIASIKYMRRVLGKDSRIVVAFEQDEYFAYKERPSPFFPLKVRLSMAVYLGANVVTVYPLPPKDAATQQLSDHYLRMFRLLGVQYSFADELDPNVDEKVARGMTDINTRIPHVEGVSTRDRVEKMFGEDDRPDLYNEGVLMGRGEVLDELLSSLSPESSLPFSHVILSDLAIIS